MDFIQWDILLWWWNYQWWWYYSRKKSWSPWYFSQEWPKLHDIQLNEGGDGWFHCNELSLVLICGIAINGNGNEEPHILSCHCRNQSGHYYQINSARQEVLIFWFTSLAHTVNHLFTKGSRIKLTTFLREYGLFASIPASCLNDVTTHIVIILIFWNHHVRNMLQWRQKNYNWRSAISQ